MLSWEHFDGLGLLRSWVLRIRVLHTIRNDAIHDIEAYEAANELARVCHAG